MATRKQRRIVRASVRELLKTIYQINNATRAASPGGKRITKAEWREIMETALAGWVDSYADVLSEAARKPE